MKKITIVPLLVGILLAVVFAFPDFTSPFCQAGEKDAKTTSPPGKENSRKNIQWLVFSATEHQRERQMVMKQMHISPKDLHKYMSLKDLEDPHIRSEDLKEQSGQIYIALADLRDDGVKEIFAYVKSMAYCGTEGCTFNMYQVRGQGLVSLLDSRMEYLTIVIDFDKSGRQKVFGVLRKKTMGWHDIALNYNELFTWSWKGEHYTDPEHLK